jgi:peptidoglycan/xylan/chitin deacetylase (PgdA/CDA1 family)
LRIRSLGRYAALSIAGRCLRPAPGVHILNGHFVGRTHGSCDIFRHQLGRLAKHVQLVRIEEAVAMRMSGVTPNGAVVAFTFDDGFEECHSMIAPTLEEFGVNAAFFVNPGFVDGDRDYVEDFVNHKVLTPGKLPMSWDQIRELSDRGHVIGAHGTDHIRLTDIGESVIDQQISRCRITIESKINQSCRLFAWPYGRMNDISRAALDTALQNYDLLFASDKTATAAALGRRVVNRRHFEGDWPIEHLNVFLSSALNHVGNVIS